MRTLVLRLRHHSTGLRFIVRDGHVFADVNDDRRINQRERLAGPHRNISQAAVVAAGTSLAESYDPWLSVGAPAPGNPEFINEGPLNVAELEQFEGDAGVPATRSALECHLNFFDIDSGDGIISLRDNWRGWRRLGYGWLRSLIGTLGAALIFGRLLDGFGIDIARIPDKRRTRVTGIYDPNGEVNQGRLEEGVASLTARANAAGDRGGAIQHNDALAIIKDLANKNGGMGTVSKRQFKSLFQLCTRLNHGRKVITADQFRRLFDGTLLYLAAAVPAPNGRLFSPIGAPLTHSLLLIFAGIALVVACVPRSGDSHSWPRLLWSAALVFVSWAVSQFMPGRTAVERLVILSIGILLAASVLGRLELVEWLIWLVILIAAVIAVKQQSYPVAQYLFFCRFPLLLATTTLLLPVIAAFGAPRLFKSMLALDFFGIAFVVMLTVLAAQVFVTTASLIANQAGMRHFSVKRWDAPGAFIDRCWLVLVILIVLPLAIALVWQAEVSTPFAALAVLIGGVAGIGFPRLVAIGGNVGRARNFALGAQRILGGLLITEPGYVEEGNSTLIAGHLHSFLFFIATLVLYGIGYWLLKPTGPYQAPAIAFVIFMLIMLGWLLPALSFFADKYRVSTLLAISVVPFVLYFINDIDHYFEVQPSTSPVAAATSNDLRQAFNARLARSMRLHSREEPVVVAVAAGGGGGSAAYWTTRVLAGLQQDNGTRFTDSVHLVSSVSGGSIGALYFIDAFDQPERHHVAPTDARWEKTLETARSSTLEAVAWGLAYPDLWRFLSISPWNRSLDRGWAFEEALDRKLSSRGILLSQWRGGIVDGHVPAVLFNATVSETGERLVLSPLRVNGAIPGCSDEPVAISQRDACSDRIDARTLESVYGSGADLRAVTAARLSATFPWVTPISRARGELPSERRVHLADGGYYDNEGIVTLVEWTRKALEFSPASGVTRLLIVDIRLAELEADIPRRTGWLYEWLGPITTMMSTRGSSQTSRNATDVKLLTDLQSAAGMEIKFVSFSLATDTSVSWRLSGADVSAIDAAWNSEKVCEARRVTQEFLSAQAGQQCSD